MVYVSHNFRVGFEIKFHILNFADAFATPANRTKPKIDLHPTTNPTILIRYTLLD